MFPVLIKHQRTHMRREREKENESEMMPNKVQTLIEAFPRIKAFITPLSYLHPSTQECVYSVIVQFILWPLPQCRYHCSLSSAPS